MSVQLMNRLLGLASMLLLAVVLAQFAIGDLHGYPFLVFGIVAGAIGLARLLSWIRKPGL